jgi:selenocysteine-specific elongation factor
VGTAGHIDHGKTALVKALTGVDADTLTEEKRRGITIELGFVFLEAPERTKQVVFIDVPGHEKLVKTMVAGASSIDAALLVLAADEGINVQTREHFDILKLLGVPTGIVVLTKSDLVDKERLVELDSEVRDFVKDTFLQDAPILPASAVTGAGITDVKQALLDLADEAGERLDSGIFRMPVDRMFTMTGFGTVIAGTVLSGQVTVGERIEVYPEGLTSRVRGIQVHHNQVVRSVIGHRTALNLPEIKKELLRRGQTAAFPGSLFPTHRLDARLHLLASSDRELKNRMRVRLNVGTAEVICRIMLLDTDLLKPGESALAQLVLEAPTVALPGDRFVIRSFSPVQTIGGGVVLDGSPEKHKRLDPRVTDGLRRLEGSLRDKVEQMILKAGFRPQDLHTIALKLGEREQDVSDAAAEILREKKLLSLEDSKDPLKLDIPILHMENFFRLQEFLKDEITAYLRTNPYQSEVPLSQLRARFRKWGDAHIFDNLLHSMEETDDFVVKGGRIKPTGYEVVMSTKDHEWAAEIEEVFRRGGIAAPVEGEVRERLGIPEKAFADIINVLLEQGRLVRLDDKVTYHPQALSKVRAFVIEYIRRQGSITLAELRDALKFSRKYAQAILEYFDAAGLTRRVGDKRMLGKDGKA